MVAPRPDGGPNRFEARAVGGCRGMGATSWRRRPRRRLARRSTCRLDRGPRPSFAAPAFRPSRCRIRRIWGTEPGPIRRSVVAVDRPEPASDPRPRSSRNGRRAYGVLDSQTAPRRTIEGRGPASRQPAMGSAGARRRDRPAGLRFRWLSVHPCSLDRGHAHDLAGPPDAGALGAARTSRHGCRATAPGGSFARAAAARASGASRRCTAAR